MKASWDSGLNRIALLLGVVWLGAVAHASAQTSSAVEATTVAAAEPAGVAYDSAGNLYIAVLNDHIILEVSTTGLVTTVAGTGQQGYGGDGGAATSALLDSPAGVALDSSGNIYIADTHNNRIREISNGTITTIAGTGTAGFSGDGGAATLAQLDRPTAVSVDATGNVYIADTNNFRIRKISGGTITTVAGDGEQTYSGDGGPAISAGLDSPYGVAADTLTLGKFYIADTHNQRVRAVDATGNITTLAGTGAESYGGDGGAGSSAGLARPWGLTVDANDHVFLADSDNNRIREIVGTTITTTVGDGEQGFSGDTAAAASAVLDTPRSAAVSGAGVLALADTHNQRVRAVSSSGNINTVAGIAPPLTEGLLLSAPLSGTYGGANGTLTALFSNVGKTATGALTLLDGGVPVGSATLASNSATFSLNSLAGGLNTLAVTYAGDANNAPSASGVFLISVAATSQTITFPAPPTPVVYSSGLTATLTATASSGLPITYGVSGPATVNGSTVTYTGPGTVVITATQVGDSDYALASASQTVIVVPVVVVSGVSPSTVTLGSASQPISVSGSGFTSGSVIQVNGTALPTTFVSSTSLTASIPAADLLTLGTLNITVSNSSPVQVSLPQSFTVTAPPLSATLSAPATTSSGQQPSISLQLQSGYPVAITGVFTLTFTPSGTGVDDPAIQFATGGRTFDFTIPANSTTAPSVSIQAGTVAGTITISLALTVDGVNVTPAAARSVQIAVPAVAPTVSSISFSQSGATLTVTVRGFSNTRDMTQASFTFTAGPGTSLATTALSLPMGTLFGGWFSQAASDPYGSTFTYTQTFNLSDPTTLIQSVSVILTNSAGASASATSP